MKTIFVVIVAGIIGYVSAWCVRTISSANSEEVTGERDRAITLTLDDDGFPEDPDKEGDSSGKEKGRGQKYANSDLREWLLGAIAIDDYSLRDAASREWAKSVEAAEILNLFAEGHTDAGWWVLRDWAVIEPERAAMLAMNREDAKGEERRLAVSVIGGAVRHLLINDPDAALALERKISGYRTAEFSEFPPFEVEDWEPSRIKSVLETIALFSDPAGKLQLGKNLLIEWGATEPEKAIRWMEENIPSRSRSAVTISLLEPWIKTDFESAASFVGKRVNGEKQDRRILRHFLNAAVEVDRGSLVKWMRNEDISMMKDMSWSAFESFTSASRDIAERLGPEFEWIAEPRREPQDRNRRYIEWPLKNRMDARRWSRLVKSGGGYAMSSYQWTAESLNEGMKLVEEEPGEFPPELPSRIAGEWAKREPEKAVAWASQLSLGNQIESAEAALGVWFETQPKSALAYVESLPDVDFRRFAVERISQDWLERDPGAAVDWIEQLQPGIDRDIGLRETAARFRKADPQRAFESANRIGHEVIRDEALEKVLQTWHQRNADEALNHLDSANLSRLRLEELKASLTATN